MEGKSWLPNSLVYFIIGVAVLAWLGAMVFNFHTGTSDGLSFNTVIDQALSGEVCKLSESSDGTSVVYYTECQDGSLPAGRVTKSRLISVAEYLQQEQALRLQRAALADQQPPTFAAPEISMARPSAWEGLATAFAVLVLVLLVGGVVAFFVRQAQSSNTGAFTFGKSTARRFTSDKPKCFQDGSAVES